MTMIKKYIEDKDGNQVLPITHFSAVKDSNGNTLEDVLWEEKEYDPTHYSGMGKVVLKKNMVSGVNTLTQNMMQATNTIYVIRYDFTLGEDIRIPDDCVLEFDGGSISAGSGENKDTVTGTNTSINAGLVKIFNTNVTLAGTWNNNETHISWFLASIPDYNAAIVKAMSLGCAVNFDRKTLEISASITQTVPLYNGTLSVLSTLSEPLEYVVNSSSWGSRMNNITILANNKANIGIYANSGQQFNYMDTIMVRDCIQFGIKVLEAWMGEWHKLIVWGCGVGMQVANANGTRLEKVELLHCGKALVVESGAAFVADGLDTSYSTDRDIDLLYPSGGVQINNWYTESFYGGANKSLIHITNIGSLGINNAICTCNGGRFLEIDNLYENSSISSIILSNVSIFNYNAVDNKLIYNPDNIYVRNFILNGVSYNPEYESLDWSSKYLINTNINGVIRHNGILAPGISFGTYDTGKDFLISNDVARCFYVWKNVSTNDYLCALDERYNLGYIAKITVTANENTYQLITENNTILYSNVPSADFNVLTNTGNSIYIVPKRNFDLITTEAISRKI